MNPETPPPIDLRKPTIFNAQNGIAPHETATELRPLISGDANIQNPWTPFSDDNLWLAVATNTATKYVAVSPADVVTETFSRPLQNFEKELYRVGFADQKGIETE